MHDKVYLLGLDAKEAERQSQRHATEGLAVDYIEIAKAKGL